MGLEMSSRALGYTHLGILLLLLLLALRRPRPAIGLAALATAFALTLALPVMWVGPAWAEQSPEFRRFAWGFFVAFASSLGLPFATGACAVTILARRDPAPRVAARAGWVLAAYLAGLLASLPVSFNYSLAYLFLR